MSDLVEDRFCRCAIQLMFIFFDFQYTPGDLAQSTRGHISPTPSTVISFSSVPMGRQLNTDVPLALYITGKNLHVFQSK